MPRYVVERTFPDGLVIPSNQQARDTAAQVAAKNAEVGVTSLHSYVTPDNRKTFCIYDGPNGDAIRKAADPNGLPVDSITPVNVLDPSFYNVQA